MQRRVSMVDVAAAAGVSGQTVSRVVNGSPRVDPATRARVEAAMERLGYRMHRAARALRTGRTETIGLMVSSLATVGNSRMLQAIADAAAARGYALTVVTASSADAVADGFARLHDQGIDGAIILNEATAVAEGLARPEGLALVVVDAAHPLAGSGIASVRTDHAVGARAATEHLLARVGPGGGTVHHLAGPTDSFAAAERERGWREALVAAGRAVPEPARGDWTAASGHSALERILEGAWGGDAVTALFAANDQMALGALRALADRGRRVPDDVAVVGFDDIADAADYRPPLSTIRQDFDQLGERALTTLAALIAGDEAAGVVLEPQLVVRQSSAG